MVHGPGAGGNVEVCDRFNEFDVEEDDMIGVGGGGLHGHR